MQFNSYNWATANSKACGFLVTIKKKKGKKTFIWEREKMVSFYDVCFNAFI